MHFVRETYAMHFVIDGSLKQDSTRLKAIAPSRILPKRADGIRHWAPLVDYVYARFAALFCPKSHSVFSFPTLFLSNRSSTNLRLIFMAALNKVQRSKVYPAAKTAILSKYPSTHDIPKWSEIGTLVRIRFREIVISQLQLTDNGDVAEHLKLHENEIDDIVHRKVKSLREQRNQSK